MSNKLKKSNKFFMIDMELMLHDLLVDIMERFDYDIEQAIEYLNSIIETIEDEITQEAEDNESNE